MVLSRSEDDQSQKNQPVTNDSNDEQTTLRAAISRHVEKECVSFHTPGHKGRARLVRFEGAANRYLSCDLTELPGLDDLTQPLGVLGKLEERAAKVWGAHSSILSVNGASAGLIAALIMLARRGSQVLVPRNCHRSVLSALILTGLEPVWFDPVWEESWGIWGPVTANIVAAALEGQPKDNLAGILIVSPTYAGAVSEIRQIAAICEQQNLPLLVDEAHGAHCLLPDTIRHSALNAGADLVVHSLHKTVGALTQTGAVHISSQGASRFSFNANELRLGLNLVQSSSPSYIFLSSIDEVISTFESGHGLAELALIERLGVTLRSQVNQLAGIKIYEPEFGFSNSTALLTCLNPPALYEFLIERGIYPEALLGSGLLLLLGTGSNETDVKILVKALNEFEQSSMHNSQAPRQSIERPKPIDQVLKPRESFFMPSRSVPWQDAVGEISAQCLAPCPPGWPVIVPGQRIEADHMRWQNPRSIRVVVRPS